MHEKKTIQTHVLIKEMDRDNNSSTANHGRDATNVGKRTAQTTYRLGTTGHQLFPLLHWDGNLLTGTQHGYGCYHNTSDIINCQYNSLAVHSQALFFITTPPVAQLARCRVGDETCTESKDNHLVINEREVHLLGHISLPLSSFTRSPTKDAICCMKELPERSMQITVYDIHTIHTSCTSFSSR